MNGLFLYIFAALGLGISFFKNRRKTQMALVKAWKSFEGILPQFLAIIFIIGMMLSIVSPQQITQLIGRGSGWFGVIVGKTGNRDIRISARSDGTINVQIIAEKLGGGGHFSSAAVAFDSSSITEVKTALLNVLDTNLTEATNDAKKSRGNKED